MTVLFAGRWLAERVPALARWSIPAPVVGGGLFAAVATILHETAGIEVSLDPTLRAPLLLAFFSTLGLGADVRTLVKGGRTLVWFIVVSIGLIVAQNVVGMAAALALDLHPLVGLLAGSITFTGGHGTGAAYAGRFVEVQNIQGAMELAMACATAGIVIGGFVGGPVAARLIARHGLRGERDAARVRAKGAGEGGAGVPPPEPVTPDGFLAATLAIVVCVGAGGELSKLFANSPVILPDFIWSLLLGLVIRNVGSATGLVRLSPAAVDLLGAVTLSLFLVIALISLRLWELSGVAGPLLVIIALQTLLNIVYAYWITFRAMGGGYDGAVLAAGHIGFGLSSTACAMAILESVTDRHGPSPQAFLIIPLVGAFFIDIANALVIQGFLALPMFRF